VPTYLLNTCCPDWDEGFSMNACCPISVNACVSLSKTGKLCGIRDPDENENATRPDYYTKKTVGTTQSGGYYLDPSGLPSCDDGVASTFTKTGNYTYTNNSVTDYSVNSEGICESDISSTYSGSSSFSQTETCCPDAGDCPTYDISCSSSRDEDGSWSGQSVETFFDGEESHTTTYPITARCPSNYNDDPTSETNYSDVDAETSALSRVDEWTQSNGCQSSDFRSSSYLTNNKIFVNKTTVKYEAVISGLIVGFCYEGRITIQKATINFDQYGKRISPVEDDWELYSYVTIPEFEADEVFTRFGGGALNVSDQQFMDENYSLNPLDYPSVFPQNEDGTLVDPDALVITPVVSLPESKTIDYRVLPAIMRRIDCAS